MDFESAEEAEVRPKKASQRKFNVSFLIFYTTDFFSFQLIKKWSK